MKTLPQHWHVNIVKESKSPYLSKFKDWFTSRCKFTPFFNTNIYGFDGDYLCYNCGEYITLKQWNDCVFGVDEVEFEQGEEVLVKDSHHDSWTEAKFICEYKDKFLVEWKSDFYLWHECKKKPSELDIKIKELRKLAEEKGMKITINFE